jgi:hypothetical protein
MQASRLITDAKSAYERSWDGGHRVNRSESVRSVVVIGSDPAGLTAAT